MAGATSANKVRRIATSLIDAVLSAVGPRAMNGYLRGVHSLTSLPFAGPRLESRLLNLPSPREFEVYITQGDVVFAYATDAVDDLNYPARNNLRGWETRSREIFLALAANAEQVVDVGAYTGVYSILASLANSNSEIAAFEPNPALIGLLRRNTGRNCPDSRVAVHPVALVETPSEVKMFVNLGGGSSSTASLVSDKASSQEVFSVPGLRLDDALPDWRPSLMKVDVEGSECKVLKGAPRMLKTGRPVILMEALSAGELKLQSDLLREFGYLSPIKISTSPGSGDERNFLWVHPTRQAEVDRALSQG